MGLYPRLVLKRARPPGNITIPAEVISSASSHADNHAAPQERPSAVSRPGGSLIWQGCVTAANSRHKRVAPNVYIASIVEISAKDVSRPGYRNTSDIVCRTVGVELIISAPTEAVARPSVPGAPYTVQAKPNQPHVFTDRPASGKRDGWNARWREVGQCENRQVRAVQKVVCCVDLSDCCHCPCRIGRSIVVHVMEVDGMLSRRPAKYAVLGSQYVRGVDQCSAAYVIDILGI
jgi:hypothetical protein